jgi:pimeloyl-ACP methyl ester carboxylesterase
VDALWRDYRLITWDYRGLFESDNPASMRDLQLVHHVEDALAILQAEQVERAVIFGWSMGVQIALDLAATAPEQVAGLVLANGTYGQVFSTGFQPIFAVPGLPKRLHAFTEWLGTRPAAQAVLAHLTQLTEWPVTGLMFLTAGRRAPQLRPILRRYYTDVLGPSFHSFMRLFQELDAHSVYHLLPEIAAPALIISGRLDFLTPASQSDEMARRMPNAEQLSILRASHFAVMERPEIVVGAMRRFLSERVTW